MKGRPARAAEAPSPEFLPSLPTGGFVVLDGEVHYRISGYRQMAPFLASIPSDTDLWMFIASGGGLTAGRGDADGSLFPYETVDRLHDAHHHTGPLTLVRVDRPGADAVLWEPFAPGTAVDGGVERNLYKNATGNRLVFEELNRSLGLAFRYSWSACDEYGWVRTARLENRGAAPARGMFLDGLRNIRPWGAPLHLYQQASNLVDAYKTSELDAETGLGIFSLTAGITDRAEAVEVLRANSVWCCGLDECRAHLSLEAVEAFRAGRVPGRDAVLNGARGNYLVSSGFDLAPAGVLRWHLAGDTGRDHLRIAELRRRILDGSDPSADLDRKLRQAGENLRRNVASADGLQLTGRAESWCHHFANVLFNNMRGGVFARNHQVPADDFRRFLQVRNRAAADRHRSLLGALPGQLTCHDLRDAARATGDADLVRLCHEYLPLHFSRRHGDPSRPWNRFSIRVRDDAGEKILSYEGNWRDIFQNWEALCTSFPGFLPNVVAKFVNASTVDGHNPYRISQDGVDWETVEPDDPWSNIGYWGDHQIIYLLKLLEAWEQFEPGALPARLDAAIFSYAEVPYRIAPYAQMLRSPGATISFDADLAARIDERVAALGTDGKLLRGPDGSIHHANLLEKLLVPALAKLSNLVPGAGIWLNTQRPEWNDANNALASGGCSVVTLGHLRRYLVFLGGLLARSDARALPVSSEVVAWFDGIEAALAAEEALPAGAPVSPRERKRRLDVRGEAFSRYRAAVYAHGFSGRTDLALDRVAGLCRTARALIDRDLAANRRDDGLFHTYNVLEIAADGSGLTMHRLPEMLEGQVSALSSGLLEPAAALGILDRLFASDLYRPRERSFMLYPERTLPGFLARNVVPEAPALAIPLLRDLLAADDRTVLARDAGGTLRFCGDLRHAGDLGGALDRVADDGTRAEAVARDRTAVLELFEAVFSHKSYTGRSGVMYGYEGLGCIYWHMVAKLLLAVQEIHLRAGDEGRPRAVRDELARMYFRVRAGIGYEKTVSEYGAFPTDPYSHTPPAGGAKQPGMTGQVKEEILTRRGELGIRVREGTLCFRPSLLRRSEFLAGADEFHYYDVEGRARALPLAAGQLAFTVCQVPVIYSLVEGDGTVQVALTDGGTTTHAGDRLDPSVAAAIFARRGIVDHVRVGIAARTLCAV